MLSTQVESFAKGFLQELISEPRCERQERVGLCYGLNFIPPNSYTEALTCSVMVFGGGTPGRSLGLDEIIRVGLWDAG